MAEPKPNGAKAERRIFTTLAEPREQLIKLLEQRVRDLHEEIDSYLNKYQMPWDEANRKFHELTQFGIIEKEDDLMQWEDANLFLDSFKKTHKKLTNA